MCGSPSECFTSSLISWNDMRSLRMCSKLCQPKSTPAIVPAITQVMASSTISDSISIAPEHLRLGGRRADHAVDVARQVEDQRGGDRRRA